MSIGKFDKRLTDTIRIWGKGNYGFWSAIAGYPVLAYGFFAILFDLWGWLHAWWHVALIAVITYGITVVVQFAVRRERPKFEEMTSYRMWWRTYSLPSGHSAESSALAAGILLMTNFPEQTYAIFFGVIFAVFALLIGISRLVVGVHYFSDVIIGFALGILIAFLYSQAVLQ